ncbi:MAG: trigger factor [Tannerella sp.]|jgi:trigger factor|nr:trigger factor [Tannerella sp.]
MNISHVSNDATSGIIKLEIEKKDYEAQVDKNLRQYRQKADIPGFRRGMVPLGVIRKMYGKHVLTDVINKLVSDSLVDYIDANGLKVLGQPVPNRADQKPIDFDTEENFEFSFDIALSPVISVHPTKEDKLTRYQVNVDEIMVDKQIDTYCRNFGSYDDIIDEVEAEDLVKGTLTEWEDGQPKEGGIRVENAVLMPQYIKEETERVKFIGAKRHDEIIFNVKNAYQDSTAEIASLLEIDKEAAGTLTSDFCFKVQEITRFKAAELNQELFDKLFGEGVVKSEEECREQTKFILNEQLQPQSDYKFWLEIRALLLKKAEDISFADDILKRWLISIDEKNTPEKVEAEYPAMIENIKFQLIKRQLMESNGLDIEDSDVKAYALQIAKSQYAQHGIFSVPEVLLERHAKNLLEKKDTMEYLVEHTMEKKLAAWIEEKTDVTTKEVSLDEFEKLFI